MKTDKSGKKHQKSNILSHIFPPIMEGADPLVDNIFRVIIFLFPLYLYQDKALMGLSGKDILTGVVVLLMGLWCLYKAIKGDYFREIAMQRTKAFAMATFVLVLILFAVQFNNINSEVTHTYIYLGAFILIFCSIYAGGGRRYYLQLLTASFTLVYICIYFHIFTGMASVLGAERLLDKPQELIPVLMLSTSTGSILYLTEENERLQKLYLFLTAAGLVIFFLYGDMMAFCIMLLFVMGLQYMGRPTITHMKKSLILVFLYGFCASNAPLITYFGAKGITREYDLEFSIYIDIAIAIAGLIVTGYWDKLDKDEQEGPGVIRLSEWYGRAIMGASAVLLIAFIFGSKGAKLQKSFGGKALYGVTNGLWEAVNNTSGEIWHVLVKYGVIGVAVLASLGGILGYRALAIIRDEKRDGLEKGYALLAILFIAQGLFYPFSSTSLPIYAIFVGLAIAPYRKVEITEAATDKKRNRKLAYGFTMLGYLMASALMAGFIVLAVAGAYRVLHPVNEASTVESMIQVAIENREARLLAETSEPEVGIGDLINAEEIEEVADETADEAEGLQKVSVAGEVQIIQGQSAENANVDENAQTEEVQEEATLENQQETEQPEESEESGPEAGISGGDYRIYDPNATYRSVREIVTGSKGTVNLRSIPDLSENSVIVHRLEEGQSVTRTAIGENGWSKVMYGGQEVFAVTEYLTLYTETEEQEEQAQEEAPEETPEQAAEREAAEREAAERAAAEQAAAEQAAREEAAKQEEAKKKEIKSEGKAAYTIQWTDDDKKCSIWSAGVLQGTMTITDSEGNPQKINVYGTHYQGSGKNQKSYYNISASQAESALVINVDPGFVSALKDMGYSGLYLNKQIHNW